MAQLSRPYQIALAATVFLALVWFVALRGHAASTATPAASAPAGTSAAAAKAKSAAAPSKIYHGPVPGLEGLTRDINRAHGAVAASQKDTPRLGNESAPRPGQTTAVPHAAGSGTPASKWPAVKTGASNSATTAPSSAARPVGATHTATPRASTNKSAASTDGNGIPPRQAAVESELKRGEVAVILFWNKHGADDVAVHDELQVLLAAHHEVAIHPNKAQVRKLRLTTGLELEKKIAVHYASASEVVSFGTFTKTVQVYGTPTILIVTKHGAVTTINGLTDAFAIEQTIDEARQAQS